MTLSINLASPEYLADPYPVYAQLRAEAGPTWLAHSGPLGGMWLVSRYDDVTSLLKDAHTSKNSRRVVTGEPVNPLDFALLGIDPPDHTRLRALASQAFTPNRVRELEPRIAAITDELLDRLDGRGESNFIADFALPLPVIVIAELLGVPPDERDAFRLWSNQIATSLDAARSNAATRQAADAAASQLAGYLASLIQKRRAAPRDDLISALCQARDAHDRLSEPELLGMCMLLLIAGHETTVNLLGNGLLTLLRHPEQLDRLRQEPQWMASAIEEMLRFEGPVQRATFRVSTAQLRVGSEVLQAGQQVSAVLGAANRDPDQFAAPDRFDITRQPNRHVAFGTGIHFCLGAPLARAEGRIGLGRVLERFPRLTLGSLTPDWAPNTFFRGLRSLPITF